MPAFPMPPPSHRPDRSVSRIAVSLVVAGAALAGCAAWLIGLPTIAMGIATFFVSFVPSACRELRAAWQHRRDQSLSDGGGSVDDDEGDLSAEAEIDKGDLGDGAIPETSVIPSWITCSVTRSLGTAKAHALMTALRNGINRAAFCAATGKPQAEYPAFLQNWFDMGMLERLSGRCVLTYQGRVKVAQILDDIEAM